MICSTALAPSPMYSNTSVLDCFAIIGSVHSSRIHDFSRLARSTKDLLDIVERLNHKGVVLVSNKESIDTSTPTGKLMLTMIGAINEFERTNLLERQQEGIAIAKRNGVYKGRKAVTIPDFEKHYKRYANREVSKAQLARELGISRPTLDKLIAEHLGQK